MVQYYGPAVRAAGFRLFCCFSGNDADIANGFYPGDSWVDGIAVDAYCYSYDTGSTQITDAQSIADNAVPPKPFGLWEFNASTDVTTGQTPAQVTAYFGYLQAFFTARLAAGKQNADILLFNSGTSNFLGSSNSQLAGMEGGTGTWVGGGQLHQRHRGPVALRRDRRAEDDLRGRREHERRALLGGADPDQRHVGDPRSSRRRPGVVPDGGVCPHLPDRGRVLHLRRGVHQHPV